MHPGVCLVDIINLELVNVMLMMIHFCIMIISCMIIISAGPPVLSPAHARLLRERHTADRRPSIQVDPGLEEIHSEVR